MEHEKFSKIKEEIVKAVKVYWREDMMSGYISMTNVDDMDNDEFDRTFQETISTGSEFFVEQLADRIFNILFETDRLVPNDNDGLKSIIESVKRMDDEDKHKLADKVPDIEPRASLEQRVNYNEEEKE